jgi:hypothetical protein
MIKPRDRFLLLTMVSIILGACDSYSLLDHFSLNGSIGLTSQTGILRPGESSLLYPEGGTAPYSLYAINGGLYDDGSTPEFGTIVDGAPLYSFIAGNSIGLITIRLGDSLGLTTSTTITVLPNAPASGSAARVLGNNSQVVITWSYPFPDNRIQGFRILRSRNGAAFTTLAGAEALPKFQTSFTDTAAHPSGPNIYRVFAFAGPYQSTAYAEAGVPGN